MNEMNVLQRARDVLSIEIKGVSALIERLDENFIRAVELMHHCRGKIVVTGLGKSGLICRKIAATLSSTGTPAFFLHPADGIHGDLGMVVKEDVVLAVSNSGETEELLKLLPHFKLHSLKLIVMTGKPDSTLAKAGDVVLNVGVAEEACPLGLVPTASTTAALVIGDALAVVLLEKKGFKEEDFAIRHPGGVLGRKLLLRVEDLQHRGDRLPLVGEEVSMKEALFEITSKRLGVTGVVDARGDLTGIITDGDLRRTLLTHEDIRRLHASDCMTRDPKTIAPGEFAARALDLMEQKKITSLAVTDPAARLLGLVHLHDLWETEMM